MPLSQVSCEVIQVDNTCGFADLLDPNAPAAARGWSSLLYPCVIRCVGIERRYSNSSQSWIDHEIAARVAPMRPDSHRCSQTAFAVVIYDSVRIYNVVIQAVIPRAGGVNQRSGGSNARGI